jgi:hypothetical protein
MRMKMLAGAAAAAAVALGSAAPASAALVYVGSWEVDQGPAWYSAPPNGPLAYTGQQAAALLFGGSASEYVISTNGSSVADINDEAWYSVIGYDGNQGNGGSLFPDNYSSTYLGLYYGPTDGYPYGDPSAPASAYVSDNAQGPTFTNYAFINVPEPATWALLILGVGMVGFAARRRTEAKVLAA